MKVADYFRGRRKAAALGSWLLLFCCANIFVYWDVDTLNSTDGKFGSSRVLSSLENRPMMYTFYEPIFPEEERKTGMSHKQDMEMLVAWREAWESAGWDTKVLSMNDAKLHPHYKDLLTKLKNAMEGKSQDQSEILCFMRWMAVTAAGGGWMSDYDVFPLTLTAEQGLLLPNNGQFTTFDGIIPSLLSGSAIEWDRMAHQVIDAVDLMTDHINDMTALSLISRERPEVAFVQQRKVLREVAYSSINKVDCFKTEQMVAVHFSFFRMTQAWELGLLPQVKDFHNSPGERPVYGKEFIRNWANQCGDGDKSRPIIEKPRPLVTEEPVTIIDTIRPTIHTFFMTKGPDRLLSIAQNDALIGIWENVWNEYGWQTKTLTIEDAKSHPNFLKFDEQLKKISSRELRIPFYRFIAMANLPKGGWYSDYDTFPLYMGLDDVNFPNKGKFTMYDGYTPSFMSANHDEWNRITNTLLSSLEKIDKTEEGANIVSVLQNVWETEGVDISFTNNQVLRVDREHQESKEFRCGAYIKRRAAHFKFAFLQADVLYAAPKLFRDWQDKCVIPLNKKKKLPPKK